MKKQLTVDDIVKWVMCREWSREKVQEKFGKRKTVTPLQLAKAKGVSAEDKLWILLRPEIIPEKKLHLLACDFVEDVLPIFEKECPDDKRPHRAIEAKRKWLRGKISDKQLAEAEDAAWDASWDATWAADATIRDAAWTAAKAAASAAASAADEAVGNTVWVAARDATWATTRNDWIDKQAARDAAWDRYLKMTIKVLKGG